MKWPWRACIAIGTLGFAFFTTGCGDYVSGNEYLRTAMRPAQPPQPYGYVEPERPMGEPVERDRSGVLITESGEDLSDDEWRDLQERDARVRFAPGTVRGRMEALNREMAELAARAELRGPAARAAFEAHARDFAMTERAIAERVMSMRRTPESNKFERAEIESLVADAQVTVHQARQAVFSTPPQPR